LIWDYKDSNQNHILDEMLIFFDEIHILYDINIFFIVKMQLLAVVKQ